MLLNLLPVLNGTKQRLECDEQFQYPDFELPGGEHPLTESVHVQAVVEDISDCVYLTAQVETNLHVRCARCGEPVVKPFRVEFKNLLVKELANEKDEDDEVIILEGTELDLAEVVLDNIILNMDMKYLCREDCKGVCPQCGANLNESECSCKHDHIDPRLEILRTLLKN